MSPHLDSRTVAWPWEVGIRYGVITHRAELDWPLEIDGALKPATYLYLAAGVETMALASSAGGGEGVRDECLGGNPGLNGLECRSWWW